MHDLFLALIEDVNVTPFLWPIFEGIGSATESYILALGMENLPFASVAVSLFTLPFLPLS